MITYPSYTDLQITQKELIARIKKSYRAETVTNIVIDDEFGTIIATIDKQKYVGCGWVTDDKYQKVPMGWETGIC